MKPTVEMLEACEDGAVLLLKRTRAISTAIRHHGWWYESCLPKGAYSPADYGFKYYRGNKTYKWKSTTHASGEWKTSAELLRAVSVEIVSTGNQN